MSVSHLLSDLTEPQRQAVEHTDGPLLVLAGAGSGKTRVITRRAALLARTVARPEHVLAITFTNKAAGEMRERIVALGTAGGMWICTFHSLCARLLRQYGEAVGVGRAFSIFDDADGLGVLREAINSCGLNTDNWAPRTVQERISEAKSRMLGPEAFAEQAGDFSDKTIARIYAEYQRRLSEQDACDFDDLLLLTARLLADHEAVRVALSDRFRYILIDEYQDTNHTQYRIASLLAAARRNLCATGDPDQSIYAWRGADIRNIMEFEDDYPDAAVIRLEQNFRSDAPILSAASHLIAHNSRRKPKDLWTDRPGGENVHVWTCEDERMEAARVVEAVVQHMQGGGRAGDVAVFYRVNALTRVLEDAFRQARLPYQVARGVAFYQRKEIKDVLAYLRAVVNPSDETALLRAIQTPSRGIGKTTLSRLAAAAREQGVPMGRLLEEAGSELLGERLGRAPAQKVEAFARLLADLRALPPHPVQDVVEAVLKRSGLEEHLRADDGSTTDELDNVYELVTAARQFDRAAPGGMLSEWLQEISLVSDVDAVDLSGGAVTLMTLHAAKGLEFPLVFLVGLEDGLLPHKRACGAEVSPAAHSAAMEEERRLCFVGMTRAMRRLTLSHARYRMVRGVAECRAVSRFLRELPKDEIEHQSFAVERDRSTAHLGRAYEDETPPDVHEYFPGQHVRHPEYGDGRIVGLERRGRSAYVRVMFEDYGSRSFALEHSPLTVIEWPE